MGSQIAAWDADPVGQFAGFVSSPAYLATSRRLGDVQDDEEETVSAASAAVYIAMFGAVVRWLATRGKRFSELTEKDLAAFLEHRDAAGNLQIQSGIAHRYLRLLERCYVHLRIARNPAQHAIFQAYKTQSLAQDAATQVLAPEEVELFVAALPSHGQRRVRPGFVNGWKRRRDRAMQLSMAMGGLMVAEVVGLQLSEVDRQQQLDGSMRISITPEGKHETCVAHETFLPKRAADEMATWLEERTQMPIPGSLVFPANLEGDALAKSTVYRQVTATFARAAIEVGHRGGRILRNTFAVSALATGITDDELRERLGLAELRSVQTYKTAMVKR